MAFKKLQKEEEKLQKAAIGCEGKNCQGGGKPDSKEASREGKKA